MCSSKTKLEGSSSVDLTPTTISHIDGRPVLQPNCSNRTILPLLDRRSSLKNASKKSSTPLLLQPLSSPTKTTATKTTTTTTTTPPISPKLKSPRPPAIKRSSANDPPNGSLNSSNEKLSTVPKATTKSPTLLKKSKSNLREISSMKYSSSLIVEAPGSIAAARRELVANMQVQRKMRIAHYGRTKSAKYEGKVVPLIDTCATPTTTTAREEKRCNFITPNSDPIYVAYHDEEWGVPAHDDKLLFELLVLTGAQVGSNWTSVLKKRQDFRDAFSGFDAEIVSKYNEKKITSISADYGIEISLVRGVVDNSKRILEVKREFGSLDKYLWGFVNHKPIATQYKSCFKIPVKTSKSESISKDMVRRGFRLVGPTVMHSFMQAAGHTNDHLITCPRHTQCQPPTVAPAL